MKKKLGVVSIQFILAMSASQLAADGKVSEYPNINDLAGVVVETRHIPFSKDGKPHKAHVDYKVLHNQDSGVTQSEATKLAESAIKEDAEKESDQKNTTLGLFSAISGVVSSAGSVVASLMGKLWGGGAVP